MSVQVILLERVRNLGNLGDTVTVKPGYARNLLIPKKKALPATAANIELFNKQRAELEKREKEVLAEAQERAVKLNAVSLVIAAQASDEGKLYGSIGVNEIKDAIRAQSIDVLKREIQMPEGAIHSIGEYGVEVLVHSDVVATVKLTVVAAK